MTTTAFGKKEKYAPNKLPLGWMMLTGGIAGSIAEVNIFSSRLPPFLSTQQKLDCNYKDNKGKHLNIPEC